jgi:hypothetical protein
MLARSNSACLIAPMRSRKRPINLRQSRLSSPGGSFKAASVSDLSIASSSASCSKTETWISITWVSPLVFFVTGLFAQPGLSFSSLSCTGTNKFPQHQASCGPKVSRQMLSGNVGQSEAEQRLIRAASKNRNCERHALFDNRRAWPRLGEGRVLVVQIVLQRKSDRLAPNQKFQHSFLVASRQF